LLAEKTSEKTVCVRVISTQTLDSAFLIRRVWPTANPTNSALVIFNSIPLPDFELEIVHQMLFTGFRFLFDFSHASLSFGTFLGPKYPAGYRFKLQSYGFPRTDIYKPKRFFVQSCFRLLFALPNAPGLPVSAVRPLEDTPGQRIVNHFDTVV
jgi:hypothetical protein